ncbi:MAG: hypothetical protein GWO20_00585 [Candidatus Korarchaeota archaeon]|nr:hypothetical protein [Candidatus Korarchaeota archaeon]NIU82077.1 hypothetical protein [Candidatus Thorarchaeota archaeon]NIW12497.1 hypothetical protein [Candidatus Thorarchaeota archaeon]NIW50711.1 hypothetical protein [Candidatus Korarchaeota archaeon]
MTEGKYEDAVARLYRAVELVSQIKRYELGLDELSEGRHITQKDLQEALSRRGIPIPNILELLKKYEASYCARLKLL